MDIPEGEEWEKETEKIIEVIIVAENFPKLTTDTRLQIQNFQITLNRINTKNYLGVLYLH